MQKKKNNQLVNLLFNVVIPVIILTRFNKEEYLGPVYGLLVALAFPLFYGLYELIIQKERNYLSAIGFVGVLLTGVIGILQFPPHWVAVKEAAIPLVLGLIVLFSTNTSWQLINKVIYNRELLDIDRIESTLTSPDQQQRRTKILNRSNLFLSFSFFLSSLLNFILAKTIVVSDAGTVAFSEELGRMTALSFPVIVLPSMVVMLLVLWYLMSSLRKLTHLSTKEIMAEKLREDG